MWLDEKCPPVTNTVHVVSKPKVRWQVLERILSLWQPDMCHVSCEWFKRHRVWNSCSIVIKEAVLVSVLVPMGTQALLSAEWDPHTVQSSYFWVWGKQIHSQVCTFVFVYRIVNDVSYRRLLCHSHLKSIFAPLHPFALICRLATTA